MSDEDSPPTQTFLPAPGSRRAKARVKVNEAPRVARADAATSVAERPAPRGRDAAIAFKALRVDPAKVSIAPMQPTRQFWVGAFADAPFDCKHIAGVTFQKWSGIVEADPKTGALILDRARPGNVVDLDDEIIQKVLDHAAAKVVRVTGNRADATGNYRCDSFNVSVKGYRPTPKDKPIGAYIYMIEIEDRMPRGWRDEKPPAMWEPEVEKE